MGFIERLYRTKRKYVFRFGKDVPCMIDMKKRSRERFMYADDINPLVIVRLIRAMRKASNCSIIRYGRRCMDIYEVKVRLIDSKGETFYYPMIRMWPGNDPYMVSYAINKWYQTSEITEKNLIYFFDKFKNNNFDQPFKFRIRVVTQHHKKKFTKKESAKFVE